MDQYYVSTFLFSGFSNETKCVYIEVMILLQLFCIEAPNRKRFELLRAKQNARAMLLLFNAFAQTAVYYSDHNGELEISTEIAPLILP